VEALFVELYLDEDVDVLVADLVRARGLAVLTTREAGRLGSTDDEQLAFTASRGMALVTHNRADFERLAALYLTDGKRYMGILIVVRRPPYETARRLVAMLNSYTADELHDSVRYI
jgi:hypothetical protein